MTQRLMEKLTALGIKVINQEPPSNLAVPSARSTTRYAHRHAKSADALAASIKQNINAISRQYPNTHKRSPRTTNSPRTSIH